MKSKNVDSYTPKIYIPSFRTKDELGNPCHVYEDDAGRIIPSVTSILKESLNLYQYKHSGASYAANRGTMCHLACQLHDEHDLDESTLDPVIIPYLEQYKLAKKQYGVTVEANEIRRYHNTMFYAGSVDAIIKIKKRGIWDLKTGKAEGWHRFQTALYAGMLKEELGELERYCLYLKPDSFQLVQHTCPTDFRDARVLLADLRIENKDVYTDEEISIIKAADNIRINNGYKPKGRITQ